MYRVTESTVPNKALRVPEEGRWTTGLFQCCISIEEADEEGIEWVMVFPAILHARVASWLQGASVRLACCTYTFGWAYCAWLFAAPLRSEIRRKYALPEEPWSDCMVHLCCSPCAVWQEYRELEAREGMNFYMLPRTAIKDETQQKQVVQEQQQHAHQAWQSVEMQQQEVTSIQQLQESQPSATQATSPAAQATPPAASAGGMWRKLNPAESYKKRSVEIEEEDKMDHAAVHK